MVTYWAHYPGFVGVLALIGVERLFELWVSRGHAAWSFAQGGVEWGRGHYVPMVALHTSLLLLSGLESRWRGPSDVAWLAPSALVLLGISQVLRYWAVATLGRHWNVRVIVVPGAIAVRRGPYHFFRHPNYVAVVLEGLALPLFGNALLTALVFFAANAYFLRVRIACEEEALRASYANYSEVGHPMRATS